MTTTKLPNVTLGNSKLGPAIHGWSIPAGKEYSCPGESSLCRVKCYAKHGHFHHSGVQQAHLRNFEFSKTPEFSNWMVSAITAKAIQVLRIHCAGDFYSTNYITQWREIATRQKRVLFFAYTRSWREEELLPGLIEFSQLPNVSLWWSIDRATGPAPLIKGIRRAYMAVNDQDAAHAPDDCDLVFRSNRKTVMKRTNGILVCPPENGVKTAAKITCTRCGICWQKNETYWEQTLTGFFGNETVDREILVPP